MIAQQSLSSRAWGEIALLSLIWGASFLSIRIALDEIGPLTVVAHRTVWAMLALWIVVLVGGHRIPRTLRLWGVFLIMGLLNNVLPFTLMAWGQLHVETGLTSILNAATAVFGVVLAAIFLSDERLTPRRAIGVATGFFGVCAAIGLETFRTFDLRALGQIAIVGGTLCYACAGIWARKHLADIAPQVAAAGMLTGASVFTLPLAVLVEGPPRLDLNPTTWAAIGYYALIATAFAYLLYYRVLAMAGSGNLLLCTLLIPPVAIVLGAAMRDESLPPNAYVGFGILTLGLLILDGRLFKRRQHRSRRA